ncbi:MAG: cation:proton antiporter [Aliidongia sp.]
MAAVVASSAIARAAAPLLPLPPPFIQIGLGALIGAVLDLHVTIEPELFLLLFIAPLLFLDGWRIPGKACSKTSGRFWHWRWASSSSRSSGRASSSIG